MKKAILKAYLSGKLTKKEFLNYVDTHFPGIIIKYDENFESQQDEDFYDLAEKIDFDLYSR